VVIRWLKETIGAGKQGCGPSERKNHMNKIIAFLLLVLVHAPTAAVFVTASLLLRRPAPTPIRSQTRTIGVRGRSNARWLASEVATFASLWREYLAYAHPTLQPGLSLRGAKTSVTLPSLGGKNFYNGTVITALRHTSTLEANHPAAGRKGKLEKIAVVAFVESRPGEVWMHKRGPTTTPAEFRGVNALPGGKVERGETPNQAIAREIREEMGCDVVKATPIYTAETESGLTVIHYIASITGTPTVSEKEADRIGEWFSAPATDLITNKRRMPGLDGAVEAYLGQVGSSAPKYFVRGGAVPSGYSLCAVNNSDMLCTIHALNVSLPADKKINPSQYASNIPNGGYRPSDVPQVANGTIRVAVYDAENATWLTTPDDADCHLYFISAAHSKTKYNHFDALVPHGRISHYYPNGGHTPNNQRGGGAVLNLISLAALDLDSWEGQTLIQVDTRDEIFNKIGIPDEVKNAMVGMDLTTARMFMNLFEDFQQNAEMIQHHSGDAMTASLTMPVNIKNSQVPTAHFFDLTNTNAKPNVVAGSNLGPMNSTEDVSKASKKLPTIMPTGGPADNDNINRLTNLLTTLTDTSVDGWVGIYERLWTGSLISALGLFGAVPADRIIGGNQAAALHNGPYNLPGGYTDAMDRSRVTIFPDSPALAMILADLKDPGFMRSRYCLLPRRRFNKALEVPCQLGQFSHWTVLNNFHQANMLVQDNNFDTPQSGNNRPNLCHALPKQSKLIYISSNDNMPHSALSNAGPGTSAYDFAEYTDFRSWRNAIAYMLAEHGHLDACQEAYTRMVSRAYNHMPLAHTSIPIPIQQKYVGGDDIFNALVARVALMRACHPTRTQTIDPAAAGGAPQRAIWNRFVTQFCVTPNGLRTEPGIVPAPRRAAIHAMYTQLCSPAMNWAHNMDVLVYDQATCDEWLERDLFWYQFTAAIPLNGRNEEAGHDQFDPQPWNEFLAQMPFDRYVELVEWLRTDDFGGTWPRNGSPIAIYTAVPLNRVGGNAMGADNIAHGASWNREFALPTLNVVCDRVETFPSGLDQVRMEVSGVLTYEMSPDGARVAELVSQLAPLPFITKTMTHSLTYRSVADAATYSSELCALTIASGTGEPVTGSPQLDAVFAATPLMRDSYNGRRSTLGEWMNTLNEACTVAKISFPQLHLAKSGVYGPHFADPQGLGTRSQGEYYSNSQLMWLAMHPVQLPLFIDVDHMGGTPLNHKLNLFSKSVPANNVPWSNVQVNPDAASAFEVIGAMRVAAMFARVSLHIAQGMEVRNLHHNMRTRLFTIDNYLHYNGPKMTDLIPANNSFAVDAFYIMANPLVWGFVAGSGLEPIDQNPVFGHSSIAWSFYDLSAGDGLPGWVAQGNGYNRNFANATAMVTNAAGALYVRNGHLPWAQNPALIGTQVGSDGTQTATGRRLFNYLEYTMGGRSAGYTVESSGVFNATRLDSPLNTDPNGTGGGWANYAPPRAIGLDCLAYAGFQYVTLGHNNTPTFWWRNLYPAMSAKIDRVCQPVSIEYKACLGSIKLQSLGGLTPAAGRPPAWGKPAAASLGKFAARGQPEITSLPSRPAEEKLIALSKTGVETTNLQTPAVLPSPGASARVDNGSRTINHTPPATPRTIQQRPGQVYTPPQPTAPTPVPKKILQREPPTAPLAGPQIERPTSPACLSVFSSDDESEDEPEASSHTTPPSHSRTEAQVDPKGKSVTQANTQFTPAPAYDHGGGKFGHAGSDGLTDAETTALTDVIDQINARKAGFRNGVHVIL
jgi:ADP-ribose pyrophosphatase YjhB (NUDIX family)